MSNRGEAKEQVISYLNRPKVGMGEPHSLSALSQLAVGMSLLPGELTLTINISHKLLLILKIWCLFLLITKQGSIGYVFEQREGKEEVRIQ